MSGHALHIHHWRNEYIVAREHASPERARADLDRIAQHLPDELVAGLDKSFSAQPESVVLLKRVVLDCELDLSRDPGLLAARWAYRFARALIDAVEFDCDGILRFPSLAAFRAQFIADLAAGRAWHLWYYRAFEDLQALPAARAIRTLLLQDIALGRATLTVLSTQAWHHLAVVLTRVEAARILDELGEVDDADAGDSRLLLAWLAQGAVASGTPWFVRALRFFSEALRAGHAPTRRLAQWVRLAGKLPMLASRSDAERLCAALERGDVAAIVAADPERDGETWAALAAHAEWGPGLAEAFVRMVQPSASRESGIREYFDTGFGGLALLLPEIDGLLDDEVRAALPPVPDPEPRSLAAWLTLAQCAGALCAYDLVREDFWREFFSIPAHIGAPSLGAWLEHADSGPAMARLAERAAALARGEAVRTPPCAEDFRAPLLVDQPTGIWLRFDDQAPTDAAPWRARLAAARRARRDWRYLNTDWGLPPCWQRFFTQLAQIALRRFAYRIPGFAGTSLPYMYANFLAGRGHWETATGQLKLTRPPLHTLLQLIGITRGTIRWSGPPARELVPELES